MKIITKYFLKATTALFLAYFIVFAVLRIFVFTGDGIHVGLSIFSYCFFWIWIGVLFTSFLRRQARMHEGHMNDIEDARKTKGMFIKVLAFCFKETHPKVLLAKL
jgi:hypothetical protein